MRVKLLQRGSLVILMLLAANCSGLAGEPTIVATVPPNEVIDVQIESPVATAEVTQVAEAAMLPPQETPEVNGGATLIFTGTVANKTADSSIPENLALTLHVIRSNGESAQTFDTSANDGGSYRFENIPFESGGQYIVSARHEGVIFTSEPITVSSTESALNIPFDIYEVTDDPNIVQINSLVSILQTNSDNSLEVVQVFDFGNISDRAYLEQSDGSAFSVGVRLPAGAIYEDFSGGSYQISADGTLVLDTQPVLPGESRVMHIAFTIPYSGSTNIVQTLDYPLNGQLEVLASGGMSVSGAGVIQLGTRQLGDMTFISYGGQFTQAAGEALRYSVSGSDVVQAMPSDATSNGNGVIAYVLIGVGLFVLGAALGFFIRGQKDGKITLNPKLLMKQIADLDIRYKSGEVDENSYQKQRDAIKALLVTLMKDEAQTGAD